MDPEAQDIQARLAALADGTLGREEREGLLGEIDGSPEITSDLERQREALSMLSSLDSLSAPPALHRSVESLVASTPPRMRARPRMRMRIAAVGAPIATAAAALAIVLATAGPSGPSLLNAAQVALRTPTLAPPSPSPNRPLQLTRSVQGIAFPYWQDSLGWRATGARADRVDGREVTTVFYSAARSPSAAGRVGYAIVAGRALPVPGGTTVSYAGHRYALLSSHGATVLTWRRAGHTCILAAHGVSSETLLHLAAWE